jgi:hypothetical protein
MSSTKKTTTATRADNTKPVQRDSHKKRDGTYRTASEQKEYLRNRENKNRQKQQDPEGYRQARKAYREANKAHIVNYDKEYREQNAEEMARAKREWYAKNKEKVQAQHRNYEANPEVKEKIKTRRAEKVTCECGAEISRAGISGHRKTKRHLELIEEQSKAPKKASTKKASTKKASTKKASIQIDHDLTFEENMELEAYRQFWDYIITEYKKMEDWCRSKRKAIPSDHTDSTFQMYIQTNFKKEFKALLKDLITANRDDLEEF